MSTIDSFLKALKNIVNPSSGIYVPHLSITPSKFGAIKKVKIEVWLVKGDDKELLSSVEDNYNITSDSIKNEAIDELTIKSIENILRYYGIQ